ncbi:MAG: site-specific DNA-methyltransferase, partial [Betaproteobacteria bacterium AqS2]|nr:site-specific DNA-methyltransferase [Betaproteobacteria bacterium AqS2]
MKAAAGEPNWSNRTLFQGDNLPFLRAMNSESVDLIATDPPFNKKRDFHASPGSVAAGASFEDRWSWKEDVHDDWLRKLNEEEHAQLRAAVFAAKEVHSDGMGAYICYMAVRLLEMHRLLKPTGSLYLH